MVVDILESRAYLEELGVSLRLPRPSASYSARGNFGHNYTEVTNILRMHRLM